MTKGHEPCRPKRRTTKSPTGTRTNSSPANEPVGDEADFADRLGIDQALTELLDPGTGTCVEIGCGTGIYADRIKSLGREPVGIDISSAMLGFARPRLPVVQGDAAALPFATGSVPAVVSVMAHTDMPDYEAALGEVHRILEPGGVFVHIGVHPCFCGGFADATDPATGVLIKPGYLDNSWTRDSWTDQGIRDKVGASYFPLAALLDMVANNGFRLDRFADGASPTPITLSWRAEKARNDWG